MANTEKVDNKAIIHCCIDKETYDLLLEHCRAQGQTKTTAIKRAILAYCKPVVDKNDPEAEKNANTSD